VVAGDRFIAGLNERYLGEPGPTDVLSFPLRETTSPGKTRGGGGRWSGREARGPLGDIVISVETAKRQARPGGRALAEEFRLLYLHGLLHLLGYTHDGEKDRAEMDGMLQAILKGGNAER
jgi:probable rRNA maturation factor